MSSSLWGDVPIDANLIAAEEILRRYVRDDALRTVLDRRVDGLAGRSLAEEAAVDTNRVLAYVQEMLDLGRGKP